MSIESPTRANSAEWLIIPNGDLVRRLRQQRGWTQQELAGEAGISKRTIERIENAQRRGSAFYAHTLSDVSAALGVPLNQIIQDLGPVDSSAAVATEIALDPTPTLELAAAPESESLTEAAITTPPAVSEIVVRRRRFRPALLALAAGAVLMAWGAWQLSRPVVQLVQGPPAHPALPGRPSIVVLPFASRDPGDAFLSEAMTHELTDTLATIPSLFVVSVGSAMTYQNDDDDLRRIGRELGVRYALRGEIFDNEGGRSVRTALLETETGVILSSKQFVQPPSGWVSLPAQMVEEIVIATKVRVEDEEWRRVRRKRSDDLSVDEAGIRALILMNHGRRSDVAEAKALLESAIARDPDYADGYAILGAAYIIEYANHWAVDPKLLERASELAHHALGLEPLLPQPHLTLASVYLFRGRSEAAIQEAREAIRLDPNGDWGHALLGLALAQNGQLLGAADSVNAAIRLNPRQPTNLLMPVALVRFAAGYKDEAAALLERIVESNPDLIAPRILLASYYQRRARSAEAHAAVDAVLRIRPDFTVDEAMTLFPGIDAVVSAAEMTGFRDRLHQLGLP